MIFFFSFPNLKKQFRAFSEIYRFLEMVCTNYGALYVTCVFTFHKWPQRDFPNPLALHLVPHPPPQVSKEGDAVDDDGWGGVPRRQANLIIRKVVPNWRRTH